MSRPWTLVDSGISALVVQGEMLVAAGGASSGRPGNGDFALARYHHNGSLDRRFGVGGKVRTDISATNEQAQALAIQPNGRLVAAGYTLDGEGTANPALAR